MKLSLICALAQNRAIGFENRLLYHLRADLQRFKALTTGHTIIMGRKTFESLPKGALPNRRNLVISRTWTTAAPGTEMFRSLEEALQSCKPEEEVFVIGGDQLYAVALPQAERLYLTHVLDCPTQADAFFPEWDTTEWHCLCQELHIANETNECDFCFADYVRKSRK